MQTTPSIKESQVLLIEDHLRSHGYFYEPLFDELLDHCYLAVKAQMQQGLSFMDAFEKVKSEFGREGLQRIYFETVNNLNPFTMFRNYLISAWRNLRRQKIYTTINILGLVLGISAFTTIALYVEDELKYDKFHPDHENVYRVAARVISNGQEYNEASAQFPLAEALSNDFSGITATVRLNRPYTLPLLRHGDKKFVEERFFYADASFFEVFGYRLLEGDPGQALKNPQSIVLTPGAAHRYFGYEDPMGKTIEMPVSDRVYSLEVTGIIEPVHHSHFRFDILVPMDFLLSRWQQEHGNDGPENGWFWTGTWTYVRFENEQAFQTVRDGLPGIVAKYFPPKWAEASTLETDRIDHIYLHSNKLAEIEPNGSATQVKIFSAIAVVVLLIAIINFINLMSAQGITRTKQVGVRKFMGALRSDIVKQFLLESLLLCLAAGTVALLLTHFILIPEVNEVAGKELNLRLYLTPLNLALYLGGLLVLGVFAGIYPATFFARMDALKILRGTFAMGKSGALLRQFFVVIQFMSSVILIVSVLVIGAQREYIRSLDTGFDKENVLVLKSTNATVDRKEAFKSEVRKIAGVQSVTAVLDIPGRGMSSIRFIPEGMSMDEPQQLPITYVDHDWLETLNAGLAQGRFFDRSHPSDNERGFVINEKAARLLGWEDNAVGKKLDMFAPGSPEIGKRGEVIGVIRDYNFESIHHPIRPIVMTMFDQYDYFLVKYKGVDLSTLTAELENTWARFDSQWPMQSFLMDQNLEKLYEKEDKLNRVTNYGMSFALLIAFIGIYGLSSFLISRRTKEVGVRKVLGSSMMNILAVLSKDFIRLVLLANLLAWPIAWFMMSDWLHNFQYAIDLSWVTFLIATGASLILAVFAIGYHTIKVSHSHPVRSLRYE